MGKPTYSSLCACSEVIPTWAYFLSGLIEAVILAPRLTSDAFMDHAPVIAQILVSVITLASRAASCAPSLC